MHGYYTRSKGTSSSAIKLISELKSKSAIKVEGIAMKKEDGPLLKLSGDQEQANVSATISKATVLDDVELQTNARIDLEDEVLSLGNTHERLLSHMCESKTLFKIPLFDGQSSLCFTDAQEWLDIAMIQLQKVSYTEDRFILELASYLRGAAARWFRTNQEHLKSCDEFEQQFIDKFQEQVMIQTNNTYDDSQKAFISQEPLLGNSSTLNKYVAQQSSDKFSTNQPHPSFIKTTGLSTGNEPQPNVFKFSGSPSDDPGAWLDSVLVVIENTDMNPQLGRDFAAARLIGKAQEWYRRHRLRIVDIHTFINEFIDTFMSPKRTTDTAEAAAAAVSTNEVITSNINRVTTKFEQELRLKTLIRTIDDFPSFTGKPSQNIDKWLNDMHKMLTKMNITDDTKHQQIAKKLTGAAKEWYNNHQEECLNYMSLKGELKTTFSSLIRDEMAFQRLPRQQNHNESIIDYYNHVLELCKQADPNMSDESTVKYLKQGVKQSFREKIMEQDPTTPKEFLRVARRIEDIKDSLAINTTSSFNYATPSNAYHASRPYYNNNRNYSNRREYQQQYPMHSSTIQPTASMLPHPATNVSSSSNNNDYLQRQNVTCYGCGQQGHYQRACPQNQQQQHHFQ